MAGAQSERKHKAPACIFFLPRLCNNFVPLHLDAPHFLDALFPILCLPRAQHHHGLCSSSFPHPIAVTPLQAGIQTYRIRQLPANGSPTDAGNHNLIESSFQLFHASLPHLIIATVQNNSYRTARDQSSQTVLSSFLLRSRRTIASVETRSSANWPVVKQRDSKLVSHSLSLLRAAAPRISGASLSLLTVSVFWGGLPSTRLDSARKPETRAAKGSA